MSDAACCKICTEAARIRISWLLQVVEDFGLLRFVPLHVEDKHSMAALLRSVDKANGYAFSGRPDAQAMQSYSAVATGTSPHLWPLAYCVVCLLCSSAVLSSAMIVACTSVLVGVLTNRPFLRMQIMRTQTWQPILRSASFLRTLLSGKQLMLGCWLQQRFARL